MKATGIVRRIDDLGRIVIPKELRKVLRLSEGDPLEMYTEGNSVVMSKYSPIGNISEFSGKCADGVRQATGNTVVITDRDTVIYVSSPTKSIKETLNGKLIGNDLDKVMTGYTDLTCGKIAESGPVYNSMSVYRIKSDGDVIGSIIMIADSKPIGDIENKLLEVTSKMLGSSTEE